jgi:SGNH hydrolase-like domain, acetyltransferase AlgX
MQQAGAGRTRSRRGTWVNLALTLGVCLVMAGVFEGVFRHRYAHMLYTPRPVVARIQSYLQLHPTLGFTWRPDIDVDDGIVFDVADVKFEPLSTDERGFVNHPGAIEDRREGRAVDVVGLGDSFVEHAAHGFYERFKQEGLAYHGLAIHRQCPPQYTDILRSYAAPLKPKWVVYGVFENDFSETSDYEAWKQSGLDWFAYHSGTWCGPPMGAGAPQRFMKRHLRGWYALCRVLHAKARGEKMSVTGPTETEYGQVLSHVEEAWRNARDNGVKFLLLLIPSRATIVDQPTLEAAAFDRLAEACEGVGMDVLDLRPVFAETENPASLYYEIDNHWNRSGIKVAASSMIGYMRR